MKKLILALLLFACFNINVGASGTKDSKWMECGEWQTINVETDLYTGQITITQVQDCYVGGDENHEGEYIQHYRYINPN